MFSAIPVLFALTLPGLVSPAHAGERLSRRGFLLCSAALGVGTYVTLPHFPEVVKKNDERLDALLNQGKPDKRYLRTVLESQILLIGELIFNQVSATVGVPVGMGSENSQKLRQEPPGVLYVNAVVLAPIVEEVLFRWVPSKLRGNSHGDDWGAGVISAAIFALVHNKTEDGFDFSRIPAGHYLSGIYMWYLMKHRGFSHSVVAHAAHNQTAVVLSWILKALADDER